MIDSDAPATCQACKNQQPQNSGVQRCEACGEVGTLSVPLAPVADRFTRKRLTLDDLRALPKGTPLLLSTVWSSFTALQPVTLHEVSTSSDTVYYVSLVPGHPTWPGWVASHEGRFYTLEG